MYTLEIKSPKLMMDQDQERPIKPQWVNISKTRFGKAKEQIWLIIMNIQLNLLTESAYMISDTQSQEFNSTQNRPIWPRTHILRVQPPSKVHFVTLSKKSAGSHTQWQNKAVCGQSLSHQRWPWKPHGSIKKQFSF